MPTEEESIDKASSSRRERLIALRNAKDLLDGPAEDNSVGAAHHPDDASVPAAERTHADAEKRDAVSVQEDASIEQAAAARRERLKALRAAKELFETPDDLTKQSVGHAGQSEEAEEDSELNMKFRNYLPHDKSLQEGKLAPVVLPTFEDPIAAAPAVPEKIEDPFLNIAPKKPNWDLRRDVQKKLDKLEKRTQKALYEIILEQQKNMEVLEAGGSENDG